MVQPLYPLGTDVNAAITANPNNPNATGTHEIIDRPYPVSATNPSANPAYTDPDAFKAHRTWNSAGVRILIDRSSKIPVHVYVPNSADGEASLEIPQGTGLSSQISTAITPDSSANGSLYDVRETRGIHVDTVDMSVLTPILNNYSAYNGVVYISDITGTGSAGGTSNASAILLKKGGVLPGSTKDANGNTVPNASNVEGLTIASDGAMYVQGDYNTGTTYGADSGGMPTLKTQPAANTTGNPTAYTVGTYTQKPASVMGDAVMILSNNWTNANSSGGANSSIATPTTFNGAVVSGEVLTTSTTASGGAHNFPRFLENWAGKNLGSD